MRRSLNTLFALGAVLGVASNASAQIDLSPNAPLGQVLRAEGLQRSQAYGMARELADTVGGRLSGSPALHRGYGWTIARLEAIGAKNVHLEDCGEFGLGWTPGIAQMKMQGPDHHVLNAIPVPWSVATGGMVRSAAIAVEAASEADLARYRGKLRGKIVFLGAAPKAEAPSEAPTMRLADADVASGEVMQAVRRYYGRRPGRLKALAEQAQFARRLAVFLQEEGASAVVLPSNPLAGGISAGLLTTDGSDAPGGRNWRTEERPSFPMLRTTAEDFGRVKRLLDSGKDVQIDYAVDVTVSGEREHIFNVVGELPATDPGGSGEYVLVGAHLDSWSSATGAVDNGAGVAIGLEALRILASTKAPLKRNVRIVLYAGEEQGLYCSGAYAAQHLGTVPKSQDPDQQDISTVQWRTPVGPVRAGRDYERLSAAFNVDSGSGRFRAAITGGRNPGLADVFRAWLPQISDLGVRQVFDEPEWPADQVSYTELNLPGVSFLQDPLDYDSRAHHTNIDTVERLQAEDLAQASVVMASFLALAANHKSRLPRPAPIEIKAGS